MHLLSTARRGSRCSAPLVAAGLLAAACTRAGFPARAPEQPLSADLRAADASHADGAVDDAQAVTDGRALGDAPPGRLCTGTWTAFSAPAPLLDRDGWVIEGQAAAISPDGLELYVARHEGPVYTLRVARRGSAAEAFAAPVPVPGIDPALEAHSPTIAAAGTLLFFRSDRDGGTGDQDLWVAERAASGGAFGAPAPVVAVNSAADDSSPWSLDGLTLYFRSNRPGGAGDNDLYIATRSRIDDPFDHIENLGAINSPQNDGGPVLSADGLELLFDSERPGGGGGEDIWHATRPDRDASFAAPRNVVELNSTSDDSDPALSGDGTTLYLSYDWEANGAEIWVATRECL